jgi:hypothetical protein
MPATRTELIENEIQRFLSTEEPEVVCISGHWGVGKTFAWNRYLKDARQKKRGIALERYSCVSLFGVNALDEFNWRNLQSTYELDLARRQSGKAIQRIPKRSDAPVAPRAEV